MSRHGSRTALAVALGALLAISAQASFGVPAAVAVAPAQSGHPNRVDAEAGARSVSHLPKPPATPAGPATFSQPRPAPTVPMRPARVGLDPGSGGRLVGSDGALEVTAPAGAVTAADVQAAGGLSLEVRQVLPASGSNAGGSGHYSFGTWLVQVVDGSGRPAARGLRRELTVRLHQDARAGALDLGHARVLVNPALPSWAAAPALGPSERRPAAVESAGDGVVLSASVPVAAQSAAVSFDTNAPVATFGRPDPFETDLAAGALSAGIQLDLPAGPGGLTPPLSLAYNSAGVSDQHNPAAAAPWVGEGWSLGLGAISWSEAQIT